MLNRMRCLLRARLSCELSDKTQLAPIIQTKLHLRKQFTSRQQVDIDIESEQFLLSLPRKYDVSNCKSIPWRVFKEPVSSATVVHNYHENYRQP